MEELIKKYGKPFLQELFNTFIVVPMYNNQLIYDILLKHKIITKRTTAVYCYISNTTRYDVGKVFKIRISNKSGRNIIDTIVKHEDIPLLYAA